MRKAVAIAAALLLGGCAGHPLDCAVGIPHGDCAEGTPGFYNGPGRFQADADQCHSYGLQDGTQAYADCRLKIDQQRQQAAFQRAQLVAQQNQAYQQQQQAIYDQEMANIRASGQQSTSHKPVNCTTRYVGNQAYTNCN